MVNEKLLRCLENALALVEHYGLGSTTLTCPHCQASFKDDECNTRRDVIGGMLYHEAPVIAACPKCEMEFTDETAPIQLFPHLWGGTLDGNLAAWRKAIAEAKQQQK